MGRNRFALALPAFAATALFALANGQERLWRHDPAPVVSTAAAALETDPQAARWFGFAEVVDGDTLRMDGVRLRLIGLDAPEFRQTCARDQAAVPCGREAAAALRKLVARAPTLCTSEKRDRYRRPLVTCRTEGRDIGAELVLSGMAVSYLGGYRQQESQARSARAGLWAGQFERPEDYRRRIRGG